MDKSKPLTLDPCIATLTLTLDPDPLYKGGKGQGHIGQDRSALPFFDPDPDSDPRVI